MPIKAILIECDPGNTLGGSCVRDVHNIAKKLIEFGVNRDDIEILLTDLSKKSLDNITYSHSKHLIETLDNLILDCGDTLIVLLSGHGFTKRDSSNDEIDGVDEYVNVGIQIVDDMLYKHIILKHNVDNINILMLSDTCHSGTMFDLPYRCDVMNGNKVTKISKWSDNLKLKAISLSACLDSQLSMCDIGNKAGYGGSLTVSLLEYDDVFKQLLAMNYGGVKKVFTRLGLLGQSGMLCLSHDF
jgi:hypothetical protein